MESLIRRGSAELCGVLYFSSRVFNSFVPSSDLHFRVCRSGKDMWLISDVGQQTLNYARNNSSYFYPMYGFEKTKVNEE